MTRKWLAAIGTSFTLLLILGLSANPAAARAPQQSQQSSDQQATQQGAQQGAQPQYTLPEYNAYQAAAKENNPQQRITLLNDFVAKFPNSTLLPYIYKLYYSTYNQLKDSPKTIEYADKLLALGNKIDAGTRLEALYTRTLAFNSVYNEKDPNQTAQLTTARQDALEGLQVLESLPKPANMTDAQFQEQKRGPESLFHYTAGLTSLQLKDYPTAIQYFQAAIKDNPNDAITYYRLGVTDLTENPPQMMEGFWNLARSIDLKGPGEAQVRDFLRKRLLAYQQPGCDNLIDAQMNQLLQLAATSPQRPPNYVIPSSQDLDKVRQQSNILTAINDLKTGGDKANVEWLAICGSEFPEVVGKVLEVTPQADSVQLKLYTGATPEEMQSATVPNMDLKVIGQPEAARLQHDDGVRFAGTLAGYDPSPFMLHWDKAKINPEDIPAEKGARKPHRVPPRKPAP